MNNLMMRLKTKWNIKSDWDFWMIIATFSMAGMVIGPARHVIFHLLGIHHTTPLWVKVCVYIPFVFPVYQISLLVIGSLLGQFEFFWNKEKQLFTLIFRRKAKA